MADITSGLPKLRPEELQAQQDRARIEALGQTIGTGMRRLGAAAMDIGTLPVRAIVGAANTAIRLPNAFGADIPYGFRDNPELLSSMTPYSDRLAAPSSAVQALPAMTAPVPERNVTGAPIEPAAPAPVQASASTPGTPKSGGTKGGGKNPAAMPAGAPAPLIPGETGFYMNDQLVPYGTRFLASGDGSVTQIGGPGGGASMMDGLPGGGKIVNGKFADPRDALEYGFRLQSQYRDDSMAQILRLAGNGGQLGYRARVGALANAFGSNNFGSVSVGGANALNSAIAGITSAETSAGATMGAAKVRAGSDAAQIAEQQFQFDNTPRAVGQTSVTDPATGLTTNQTSYALPPVRGSGGMPRTVDAAKPKPSYPDGTQVKLRDGRTATIKNGQPVPNE